MTTATTLVQAISSSCDWNEVAKTSFQSSKSYSYEAIDKGNNFDWSLYAIAIAGVSTK